VIEENESPDKAVIITNTSHNDAFSMAFINREPNRYHQNLHDCVSWLWNQFDRTLRNILK